MSVTMMKRVTEQTLTQSLLSLTQTRSSGVSATKRRFFSEDEYPQWLAEEARRSDTGE